jgi:hypothetical protein
LQHELEDVVHRFLELIGGRLLLRCLSDISLVISALRPLSSVAAWLA